MYDGYSKASIRKIMESKQSKYLIELRIFRVFIPQTVLLISCRDLVADKIRELSLIRLRNMNLPVGVDRVQKLADLENQMRDVTYGVAVDMVAKMDSTSFLRFFGVSEMLYQIIFRH